MIISSQNDILAELRYILYLGYSRRVLVPKALKEIKAKGLNFSNFFY